MNTTNQGETGAETENEINILLIAQKIAAQPDVSKRDPAFERLQIREYTQPIVFYNIWLNS